MTESDTKCLRQLQTIKDAGIPLTKAEQEELSLLEKRSRTDWEKDVQTLESLL